MSKVFKTISLILLFTLAATLLLTACQPKSDLKKITLFEVTHSLFYTPQYVALSLGFFEEEGLEIELVDGKGADKVMAALLSGDRSEEHTSELQSRENLVCRLLLEKKAS